MELGKKMELFMIDGVNVVPLTCAIGAQLKGVNLAEAASDSRQKPPMGCVLRCVECPPVGGDTLWANMALAYEMLPTTVKSQIEQMEMAA